MNGDGSWEITVGRAIVPEGYTLANREQRLLDWSYVDERMSESKNYWVATTRPNGHPHVMPTWAVWHDNCVFFDGSPETRRMRNIAANPNTVIHLEDGDKALVLEGETEVLKPDRELASQLVEIYGSKYAKHGYAPEIDQWDEVGIYKFQPKVVIAWTEFGVDMTRWALKRST